MMYLLPPIVFMVRVYVLDDVVTMEVCDRYLETDTINSKLVYFAMAVVVVVILLLCKEIEDPQGQEV